MSAFFGELYLRSTRPFLPAHVTEAEASFLAERLAPYRGAGPFLDIGCGHGRHLGPLQGPKNLVAGIDLDPPSLEEARRSGPVARADFFHLPFRSNAFAAMWSWYNTLFTFDDARLPTLLRELARCLRPGGLLVLHTSHIETARRQPEATYDGPLPDGSHLLETCRFDPARSRDELTRTLTLPDGRVMAASFFIRYYALDELTALLAEAGLDVRWVCGGVDGRPLTETSADLIVGAEKT